MRRNNLSSAAACLSRRKDRQVVLQLPFSLSVALHCICVKQVESVNPVAGRQGTRWTPHNRPASLPATEAGLDIADGRQHVVTTAGVGGGPSGAWRSFCRARSRNWGSAGLGRSSLADARGSKPLAALIAVWREGSSAIRSFYNGLIRHLGPATMPDSLELRARPAHDIAQKYRRQAYPGMAMRTRKVDACSSVKSRS